MNKLLFFIALFLISCNQTWSDRESSDFLNRCQREKPTDIDSQVYNDFCLCLEQEAQKTNLSYQSFLNNKLEESDLNKIISSCTNE